MRTPTYELVKYIREPQPAMLIRMRCVEVLIEWCAATRLWSAFTNGHRYPRPLLTSRTRPYLLRLLDRRLKEPDMQQHRGNPYLAA